MTRDTVIGIIVGDSNFRTDIAASVESFGAHTVFAVATTAEMRTYAGSAPDVLVLDFSQPQAHAVMAELKLLENPPTVIAAHTSGDPEVILRALRAGAREFIYPPINDGVLRKALETASAERMARDASRRTGRVLAFLSAAGSCGASMLACHVGAELRRLSDAGVLIADLDLASGTAALWTRASSSYSMLEAANNLGRLDLTFWKALVAPVQPRLDVLCAPPEIPSGDLPAARQVVEVLRFARGVYYWVVADLGAGFGPITRAIVQDVDAIYVVSTGEVTSLYHARRIVHALVEAGCRREAVKLALNRMRKGQVFGAEDARKLIGFSVEITLPEEPDEVAETHAEGRLILPQSELGRRMRALASKLAGVAPEERRTSRFSLFRSRAQEA